MYVFLTKKIIRKSIIYLTYNHFLFQKNERYNELKKRGLDNDRFVSKMIAKKTGKTEGSKWFCIGTSN